MVDSNTQESIKLRKVEVRDFPVFDGTFFPAWKKQVIRKLDAKGLLGYIVPQAGFVASSSEEKMVLDILTSCLDRRILTKTLSCNTSLELWQRLKALYQSESTVNVDRLLNKFQNYRKDARDDMGSHISKIEEMVDSLESVGQKPTLLAIMNKMLNSLPLEYNSLCTAWDATEDSKKTLQELIDRLLKEEEKMKNVKSNPRDDVALVFRRKPNQKMNANRHNKVKDDDKCYNCGLGGHYARNCKRPKKQSFYANKERNNKDYKTGVKETKKDDSIPAKGYSLGPTNGESSEWVLDSGSSYHVTNNDSLLVESAECNIRLSGVNGQVVIASKIGVVELPCLVSGVTQMLRLKDVLYIAEAATNLFAANKAFKNGAVSLQTDRGYKIIDKESSKLLATATIDKDSSIATIDLATSYRALLMKPKRTLEEWHATLGHISPSTIKAMSKNEVAKDMIIVEGRECSTCPTGHGTRAAHTTTSTLEAVSVGEAVDMDLIGPISNPVSLAGARYVLLSQDRYSKFRVVYFLKEKTEVFRAIQDLITTFKVEGSSDIKRIRTDNGSEFCNEKVRELLAIEHIILDCSSPYTPEQNGAAERSNRTILETSRCMLNHSGLPQELWAEAVAAAVYIWNRVGETKSPFEVFSGRKPTVANLFPFGTKVQKLIVERPLTKFESRTQNGYLVGFDSRTNVYRVYLPTERKVVRSSDVIFKGHAEVMNPELKDNQKIENTNNKADQVMDVYFENLISNLNNMHNEEIGTPPPELETELFDSEQFRDMSPVVKTPPPPKLRSEMGSDVLPIDEDCGQQVQQQKDSTYDLPPLSPLRRAGNISENLNTVSTDGNIFLSKNDSCPTTFEQAVTGPKKDCWLKAIKSELEAHNINQTWTKVQREPNMSLVDTRWVFTQKEDNNGKVIQYKARLVARGFSQKYGLNYFETFAPVARPESFRLLLKVAVDHDLSILQFDITTAFLNGCLEEEIYITIPEGVSGKNSECLKLNKAIYGLKQAPKTWHKTLNVVLQKLNLKSIHADPCVYKHDTESIFVLIYVDDGLIFTKDEQAGIKLIEDLSKTFQVKLIKTKLFLGMNVVVDRSLIQIDQQRHLIKLVEYLELSNCSENYNPLTNTKYLFEEDQSEVITQPYRNVIGMLLHCAIHTRPDLLFPTIFLSRFNSNPKLKHWVALLKLVKYAKTTAHYRLTFTKNNSDVTEVNVYSDADFANDINDRKSVSGGLVMIDSSPIIFFSRKQSLIARSTTHAELISAAEVLVELDWLKLFLDEIGMVYKQPKLHIDSQPAIDVINKYYETKSKFVDIKIKIVKEKSERKEFRVIKVKSEEQLADYLTKPICGQQLKRNCEMTGLRNIKTKGSTYSAKLLRMGLLSIGLLICSAITINGNKFDIASDTYWQNTELHVETGRIEYSIFFKHMNPCPVINSINQQHFKYNINDIIYKRLNNQCVEKYTNTWVPLLEKLVKTWADNARETKVRMRFRRFWQLAVGALVLSLGGFVYHRYFGDSDHNKIFELESRTDMLQEALTNVTNSLVKTIEMNKITNNLLRELTIKAEDNKEAIIQLASLMPEVAWLASTLNFNIGASERNLRRAILAAREGFVATTELSEVFNATYLSEILPKDTKILGADSLGNNTYHFRFAVKQRSEDTKVGGSFD